MKFDEKYKRPPLKFGPPHNAVEFELVDWSGRYYECDVCRTPTPWVVKTDAYIHVCSEECLALSDTELPHRSATGGYAPVPVYNYSPTPTIRAEPIEEPVALPKVPPKAAHIARPLHESDVLKAALANERELAKRLLMES